MPDNIAVTAGAGTTIAADDVGGALYQRIKPAVGADGSATDVSDTAPIPAKIVPLASGGASIFRSIDVDESEDEIKASAGQLYALLLENLHASADRFVKVYNNTAAGTTVGTTTPVITVRVKAGETINVPIPASGIAFDTGICIAATTALADADTGAPGANEVVAYAAYK